MQSIVVVKLQCIYINFIFRSMFFSQLKLFCDVFIPLIQWSAFQVIAMKVIRLANNYCQLYSYVEIFRVSISIPLSEQVFVPSCTKKIDYSYSYNFKNKRKWALNNNIERHAKNSEDILIVKNVRNSVMLWRVWFECVFVLNIDRFFTFATHALVQWRIMSTSATVKDEINLSTTTTK